MHVGIDDEMMNLELVLFPRGGLANRLRALASADLLARSTGRKLYVEWIADHDLGARWDHLFENPLPSRSWGLDALDRLSSDPRYVVCRVGRAFDPAIAQLCDRERGKSIALDNGLPLKPVGTSLADYIAQKSLFYRGLRPLPDLMRAVEHFAAAHLYDGYTVGVHIRRTDLNTPFSCIGLRAQDVSPLSAFIEEMEQVLADRPSTKFFVASDEPREEERLRLRFGSRLVTFPKATVARGKVEGVQAALSEWLLLARCNLVIGSFYSSYSSECCHLHQVPRITVLRLPPLARQLDFEYSAHHMEISREREWLSRRVAAGVQEEAGGAGATTTGGLFPFVSVIVPVFNDRERLLRCLAALEAQSYPANLYEVIVVDNGSDESVADLTSRYAHVRVALEKRPGSYAARNAGIALARGEVLAFTDSDCTPTAGWLAAALGCLQELGTCGIVAGRIQLVPRDPRDLSLVEAYASTFFLRQRDYAEQMGFGATANLVAHASAFARVGSFDAALKSSGDYDFCTRATKQGVLLRYAPEAVVNHPTITTLGGLVRKSRRLVGGNVQLRFRGRAYRLANVLRDLTVDAVEARASWRRYRAERIEGDPNLAMAGLILMLQTVRGLERLRLFLNGGYGYLR